MNRYVVQLRSLVWPAPEYRAWEKGPYRSRFLARVIACAMRRERNGLWRDAKVVEIPGAPGGAAEGQGNALRDEARPVRGPR